MFEQLRFVIARTTGRELSNLSISETDLFTDLSGKSIAIVGNARSLSNSAKGPEIDATDIVIRINRAPIPSATSHGARTDWLALATSLSQSDLARLSARRVLWMSHKRKRLSYSVAKSPGFFLHPNARWQEIKQQLGAPPTTGLLLIDLVARSDANSISLFGFDFFSSLSLSGSRNAAQVPHDFSAEKAYVKDLLLADERITLVQPAD
jgi:hypothetical protein